MPTRTVKARGLSLAEVMLVTALIGLISTIVGQLLVSEMRFCTAASERLNLEREQQLLQEVLRQDILGAASPGISLEPNGLGLAVQPVQDITFEGSAVYSDLRLVVYLYNSAQKRLQRSSWQTSPPITLNNPPVRLAPSDWTLVSGAKPQRGTGWTFLTGFRVRSEIAAPDLVSQRLWFDCQWQDRKGTQQVSYCYFTRQNP